MIVTEELKLKSNIRARCAKIIATLNTPYEQLSVEQLIEQTEKLFDYCMYNKIIKNGK
tara:strand:- start:1559 stop:1732 length:174 start_codon:yes stop_codon:yes gene_type:complete